MLDISAGLAQSILRLNVSGLGTHVKRPRPPGNSVLKSLANYLLNIDYYIV